MENATLNSNAEHHFAECKLNAECHNATVTTIDNKIEGSNPAAARA